MLTMALRTVPLLTLQSVTRPIGESCRLRSLVITPFLRMSTKAALAVDRSDTRKLRTRFPGYHPFLPTMTRSDKRKLWGFRVRMTAEGWMPPEVEAQTLDTPLPIGWQVRSLVITPTLPRYHPSAPSYHPLPLICCAIRSLVITPCLSALWNTLPSYHPLPLSSIEYAP